MNGERFHILIVDDEPNTAEYMATLLESSGYTTSWAYSGTEALVTANRQEDGNHPIDLVILDVRLPDLDGYEVCQRIKGNETLKHVSVIMVTALHSTDDKTRGLDLGADDYITKPFQSEELLARVKAVLRIRQMEREARQRAIELEQSQAQLIQVEPSPTSSTILCKPSRIACTWSSDGPYPRPSDGNTWRWPRKKWSG